MSQRCKLLSTQKFAKVRGKTGGAQIRSDKVLRPPNASNQVSAQQELAYRISIRSNSPEGISRICGQGSAFLFIQSFSEEQISENGCTNYISNSLSNSQHFDLSSNQTYGWRKPIDTSSFGYGMKSTIQQFSQSFRSNDKSAKKWMNSATSAIRDWYKKTPLYSNIN